MPPSATIDRRRWSPSLPAGAGAIHAGGGPSSSHGDGTSATRSDRGGAASSHGSSTVARVHGAARAASMGAMAIAAWLVCKPEQGLPFFWGLLVPVLPLLFMLLPGLWRNVCPLASSNQAPRRLGLTKNRAQKALPTGAAYPFGIAVFIIAIIARKLFLNTSGIATALL